MAIDVYLQIDGIGAGQYADPVLMSVIFWVEREWLAADGRKFGIGNISRAGGVPYPRHGTHKDGLQVDCHALRKDGQHMPVRWTDAEYDKDATARLIAIFLSHPSVKRSCSMARRFKAYAIGSTMTITSTSPSGSTSNEKSTASPLGGNPACASVQRPCASQANERRVHDVFW